MDRYHFQQRRASKQSRYETNTMMDSSGRLQLFDREVELRWGENLNRFQAATAPKKRGLQCYEVKYNYFEY
jgi:hypothetical protein